MCQLYDKNRDRSETGAKPVKTASFLSTMLEVLLCLVLASFLPMAVFLAVNGKYGKAFPHPYAPSHTYGVHRRTGQDEDAYVVSPAQSTG